MTTRLAINKLRAAGARSERYVGEWLPEPITDGNDDPARQVEMADSLSLAMLVLLESLSPEQRAALLLHDVFDYDARAAGRAGSTVLRVRRARRSRHLEALLAHDVELTGDGGGKVPALARSLRGRNRVARTVIHWFRLAARFPGVSLRPVEVNGGPGALVLDAEQRLVSVLALDIACGRITTISGIVNPNNLTHLGPVGDYTSLLKSVG